MPIYAYRCDSCGARKDVLQKVSDAPLTVCAECGAPSFHKELTAPAFQLKGTGWYVTDFRDNGKPKDKTPEGGGDASPAPAGEGAVAKPAEAAPAGEGAAAKPAEAAPAATPVAAASGSGSGASPGSPPASTSS